MERGFLTFDQAFSNGKKKTTLTIPQKYSVLVDIILKRMNRGLTSLEVKMNTHYVENFNKDEFLSHVNNKLGFSAANMRVFTKKKSETYIFRWSFDGSVPEAKKK